MKYIKEAISILKNRWPETLMLIALALIISFLNINFFTIEQNNAQPQFLNVFISSAIMVFFLLFKLGFLSTACKNQSQQQLPLNLLREGKDFFWRFALLAILYAMIYFIVTLAIAPFFTPQDIANTPPEKLVPVFEKVSLLDYIIITLVFIKFILFLPAIIIVTDVTIPLGFALLKYCKLKDAKGLVVLFLIQMAINSIWMALPDFGLELKYQKILSILPAFINQCLTLIIAVAAIRFVASLDLLYDNENQSESDLTEGEN